MKKTYLLCAALVAGFASGTTLASNQETSEQSCKTIMSELQGSSYKLVKRTLKNGTVQEGKGVHGTLIFQKNGQRMVAVQIDGRDGYPFSALLQSHYSFKNNKFIDRLDALTVEGHKNQPALHQFNQPTKTAKINCVNGSLVIVRPPYDPVENITITKNTMKATLVAAPWAGAVDEWVKLPS